MPHFPLWKTRNGIKVAGSHSASFAQLCSVVHIVRDEKGKSLSAKGRDSSNFMLAKHKCFGKVHLDGWWLEGQESFIDEFKSPVHVSRSRVIPCY